MELRGSVALVTGGNGGIGLGMAQALASAGCNVSIWGRNAVKNHAALQTLQGPGTFDARICDVADPDGSPFEGDPRVALKRVLADAKKMVESINKALAH